MKYQMSEEEAQFLASYDIKQFEQPSLTVDIVVFAVMEEESETSGGKTNRMDPYLTLSALMIRRACYPYKNCWALPGGFVKPWESIETCAMRELKEETSIARAYLRPFGVFSDQDRDPRGWIISNGFLALVDPKDYHLHAGTDAWDARWFRLEVKVEKSSREITGNEAELRTFYQLKLCNKEENVVLSANIEETRLFSSHHETKKYEIINQDGFAFDHASIILQAFLQLRKETENQGTIVFDLMPEKFTLNKLQQTYELILGKPLITPNFRRKIMPMVLETNERILGVSHRPAKLFIRNLESFYSS